MRTNYRRWTQYPYPGESVPPRGSPKAGNWPMFFISRRSYNDFLDPFHQRILWQIKNPDDIDWEIELFIVEETLKSLTSQQIRIAQYWGTGEITAKITAFIFRLAEKYKLGSPSVARVLGYFHATMNDAFVMTWFFKYHWDVARPNQYGRNLSTVLFPPRFPAYPSAHAVVAGCAEAVLRYFFPQESSEIKKLMEESAQSRLYAGVHFNVDNNEGLRVGRQIGEVVVSLLRAQNLNMLP
ncbi:vanadium-dependent haloperoxidase [Peribacillus sp. NPDC094092]|uniref:vanadium-dependent haloperoxidase n=1 Tax=Peribacillus sp. NPDC094092 TaxID=3390611 RepID=UPI003CFBCC37